jgi:hypothetical protein
MRDRARTLKQLIGQSLYVVDERTVADAIVARAMVRRAVPEAAFRSGERGPQVRSFRRDQGARSFRLAPSSRLRMHH